MTGEAVDSDSADAANNELVETSNLAKDVGSRQSGRVCGIFERKVVSGDLSSEEDILKAVDETAQEVGITPDRFPETEYDGVDEKDQRSGSGY